MAQVLSLENPILSGCGLESWADALSSIGCVVKLPFAFRNRICFPLLILKGIHHYWIIDFCLFVLGGLNPPPPERVVYLLVVLDNHKKGYPQERRALVVPF